MAIDLEVFGGRPVAPIDPRDAVREAPSMTQLRVRHGRRSGAYVFADELAPGTELPPVHRDDLTARFACSRCGEEHRYAQLLAISIGPDLGLDSARTSIVRLADGATPARLCPACCVALRAFVTTSPIPEPAGV